MTKLLVFMAVIVFACSFRLPVHHQLPINDPFLNREDTGKKHEMLIFLHTSPVNIYSAHTNSKQYNSGSILGAGGGFAYFYKKRSYLALLAGASLGRLIFYGDPGGYLQKTNFLFVNVSNNHVLGHVELGYGLGVGTAQWHNKLYMNTTGITPRPQNYHYNTTGVGPSFSFQYRIVKDVLLGTLYQTTLLHTDVTPAIGYQHYISVYVRCELNMRTMKAYRAPR